MTEPVPPVGARVGRYRWTICALLFAATTLNYMDRQVLGLLAPVLQKEIRWTELQYANIVTAFQAAYAIGLVAVGRWIDAIGTRRGYAGSVLVWSFAAAAHALAGTPFSFGVARFGLGLGEAGNFPAAVKAIAEWFPRRERALANGFFNSGANIGAVLAPATVPALTAWFGWQASFVVLGALGIVWLVAWNWLYARPEDSPRVSAAERAYIRSDPAEIETGRVPWLALLRHRQMWAFAVGFAFTAPIWWFYLYWLPKFLHQRYALDLTSLGPPLVIIYTMTCFGSIGGGWLSSALMRRGCSVNVARKLAMLACAVCVVPVGFAAGASHVWVATGIIGLAASAHQGWAANLFALASDMFPKRAVASVVGLGGMIGSLAAIVFSQAAGLILERTGQYWPLFAIAASAYVAALVVMHLIVPKLEPAQFS